MPKENQEHTPKQNKYYERHSFKGDIKKMKKEIKLSLKNIFVKKRIV